MAEETQDTARPDAGDGFQPEDALPRQYHDTAGYRRILRSLGLAPERDLELPAREEIQPAAPDDHLWPWLRSIGIVALVCIVMWAGVGLAISAAF